MSYQNPLRRLQIYVLVIIVLVPVSFAGADGPVWPLVESQPKRFPTSYGEFREEKELPYLHSGLDFAVDQQKDLDVLSICTGIVSKVYHGVVIVGEDPWTGELYRSEPQRYNGYIRVNDLDGDEAWEYVHVNARLVEELAESQHLPHALDMELAVGDTFTEVYLNPRIFAHLHLSRVDAGEPEWKIGNPLDILQPLAPIDIVPPIIESIELDHDESSSSLPPFSRIEITLRVSLSRKQSRYCSERRMLSPTPRIGTTVLRMMKRSSGSTR